MPYVRRIVDDELDVLLGLPAVVIEGPKAVGKTATALQRAITVVNLDLAEERELLAIDSTRINRLAPPVLLDEWQRAPAVWDLVRRAVDQGATPGTFLLTGSATPTERSLHSGAGRIVRLRLRPLSLHERGLAAPNGYSIAQALANSATEIPIEVTGDTSVDINTYVAEIVSSGFPGIRRLDATLRQVQLDSYLARIVDADFPELGHRVRRPTTLMSWLRAYAAATSTTTGYTSILDAATPGESDKPARSTTDAFRDVLTRLWILDPLPGWLPTENDLGRLASSPKHHLADCALAARLLRQTEATLKNEATPSIVGGTLLGALFESLLVGSLRVYAQAAGAETFHLRTRGGEHEVDIIVEGADGRILAIEVKLGATIDDRDVRHLAWLRDKIGDRLADAIVVTTGRQAYRRPDGIAVVPAALVAP